MQKVTPTPKFFMSVNQTCDATGLGRTTVYDLMNKGVLKSIKIGKRRLVDVESVRLLAESLEAAA